MRNTKQILIIRKDLKMSRGKECAMAAHASMAFLTKKIVFTYKDYDLIDPRLSDVEELWLKTSFKKITLQVETEQEILELHKSAQAAGLESNLITDNGVTCFKGVPTVTCLAIGPDYDEKIDPITKHLKLY